MEANKCWDTYCNSNHSDLPVAMEEKKVNKTGKV